MPKTERGADDLNDHDTWLEAKCNTIVHNHWVVVRSSDLVYRLGNKRFDGAGFTQAITDCCRKLAPDTPNLSLLFSRMTDSVLIVRADKLREDLVGQ